MAAQQLERLGTVTPTKVAYMGVTTMVVIAIAVALVPASVVKVGRPWGPCITPLPPATAPTAGPALRPAPPATSCAPTQAGMLITPCSHPPCLAVDHTIG